MFVVPIHDPSTEVAESPTLQCLKYFFPGHIPPRNPPRTWGEHWWWAGGWRAGGAELPPARRACRATTGRARLPRAPQGLKLQFVGGPPRARRAGPGPGRRSPRRRTRRRCSTRPRAGRRTAAAGPRPSAAARAPPLRHVWQGGAAGPGEDKATAGGQAEGFPGGGGGVQLNKNPTDTNAIWAVFWGGGTAENAHNFSARIDEVVGARRRIDCFRNGSPKLFRPSGGHSG